MLKEYDTIIIVDDSGSMASLWGQARKALAKLAAIASRYDTDGIEIRFLNNTGRTGNQQVKVNRLISEQDVERLFDQVKPYGATPLGMCLEDVTQSLLRALERGETCKKTNYLVITDGIPTDDAEGAIVQIARRLDRAYATLSQAGIQFIQIGTDGGARKFLETLDNDLKEKYGIRDMVDTEPYTTGELSAAKLTKLLLGGINRKVDAERSTTARPGPAYASAF
jgi:Mg-chelatase subunit ChlD